MADSTAFKVRDSQTDRLVRARKRRACTAVGCGNVIEPGELYLDVHPPERMNGYFAQCLSCAEAHSLIVHNGPDVDTTRESR